MDKNCNYWVDKSIDKEVIRNHLFSSNPIRIYPMLEDETCYFLTFNFDDKKNGNDIKGDVFAFASICDKYSMPISSVNRIVQYTGRLHRKNENKKEIIVYDSVDDNFSMIRNMFLKRKKAYEKVGYEII